jgi:hypothetical protein
VMHMQSDQGVRLAPRSRNDDVEHLLLRALRTALEQIPGLRIADGEEGAACSPPHDHDVTIALEGRPSVGIRLDIVAKGGDLYPRDVRQMLWRLRRRYERDRDPTVRDPLPIVVSRSISEGARELLRDGGFGYYDTGGSLYVPGGEIHLHIDKPAPKVDRTIRSVFVGKRVQVVHGLLATERRWFGLAEIARAANVSRSTAFETLDTLDRMNWLRSRGRGPGKERVLEDPTGLLDEWRTHHLSFRRSTLRQRYYVSSRTVDQLVADVVGICESNGIEYVATDDYAAQRYAPFLSSVARATFRLPSGAGTRIASSLKAQVVAEGANLEIIETSSRNEFLFARQLGGLDLASPIQVYLDLVRGRGRSKDMADRLRTELIGF